MKQTSISSSASPVPAIDAGAMASLISRALRSDAMVDAGWSGIPLAGGTGRDRGPFRYAGTARLADGSRRPWGVVLKAFPPPWDADPAAWDYLPREPLAYTSGLRADLPGPLRAPRCYGTAPRPDGGTWLWLADVPDAVGTWDLDRFAGAARILGRFNGAYLAGEPMPTQTWLANDWLRTFVESAAPAVEAVVEGRGMGVPPLVRRVYPPPAVALIARLWRERHLLLAAYDRLPRVLCHRDAHRRNLLTSRNPDGQEHLVAIDWTGVGAGAIGEDLAPLVLASLMFFDAPGIAPATLDAACFAAYLDGLGDAGWSGDPQVVRLGYTLTATLRFCLGVVPLQLPAFAAPDAATRRDAVTDRGLEELAKFEEAVGWPFRIALAEEAARLLRA